MIKIITFLILCVFFFTNNAFADQSCEPEGWQSSIVKIFSSDKNYSTGILIGQDLVLTVLHGLPVGEDLHIHFPTHTAEAELVDSHQGFDLALLKTTSAEYKELEITSKQIDNDSVFAVSFPADLPLTVTPGKAIKTTYKGMLTSTKIDAGSSGGAVVQCQNNRWNLVGVLRSYAAHIEGNQLVNSGLAWSIPGEQILSFMNFVNTKNQTSFAFRNHK